MTVVINKISLWNICCVHCNWIEE